VAGLSAARRTFPAESRAMSRLATLAAAVALVLTAAGSASARVTIEPDRVLAGGETRLDVRVPNARDAAIEKVVVKFPPGFVTLATEPVDGWRASVAKRDLERPVAGEGGRQITQQVDTVTFTAEDGGIERDEFRDFGLSVALPNQAQAGTSLTFEVTQTDSGGDVVRWAGPPGSPEPAPEVELTTPEGQTPPAAKQEDKNGTGLAIVALLVGLAALVLGFLAFRKTRRIAAEESDEDDGDDDEDDKGDE
jgi:periplasmic copper chaperone A